MNITKRNGKFFVGETEYATAELAIEAQLAVAAESAAALAEANARLATLAAELNAAKAMPAKPEAEKPGVRFSVSADGALTMRHTDGNRFFQRYPWFQLHRDQLAVLVEQIDTIKSYITLPDLTNMEDKLADWKRENPSARGAATARPVGRRL